MKIVNKVLDKIARRKPIFIQSKYVEPHNEFESKTAIIFGGGSGIGRSIANDLFQCGAKVIICGRNEAIFDGVQIEKIDVTDFVALETNLEVLTRNKIDIVVNSQGICPHEDFAQDFLDISYKDFDSVINVNTKSVYFITRYFSQYFIKKGISGHILNICSTEGLKGSCVPYGISKAATISLTKGFGKAYAPKGIVINGIAPGATATKMMNMSSEGNLRKDYIPSQRVCTSNEIAKAAHFLLSDAGRQMCGQILIMDGGESLH